MSFTPAVRKFHSYLLNAMSLYKGQDLSRSEILKILRERYPELEEKIEKGWIHPTDHCINHTCKGACDCSISEDAIFKRIKRGMFHIL